MAKFNNVKPKLLLHQANNFTHGNAYFSAQLSTVKDSFPLLNIWFQEFIINMVLYLCEEQLLQEEVIRPTLSCVP